MPNVGDIPLDAEQPLGLGFQVNVELVPIFAIGFFNKPRPTTWLVAFNERQQGTVELLIEFTFIFFVAHGRELANYADDSLRIAGIVPES